MKNLTEMAFASNATKLEIARCSWINNEAKHGTSTFYQTHDQAHQHQPLLWAKEFSRLNVSLGFEFLFNCEL